MVKKIWPVVPLSKGQRKDVRSEDILEDGLYRKCVTHRGGGGYDLFPAICREELRKLYGEEFVDYHTTKSFPIELIEYKATSHVDDIRWGVN